MLPPRRWSSRTATARERRSSDSARGWRRAAAPDDVLDALNQRKVEVLMFEHGLRCPGVVCPQCGWTGSQGTTCPADGAPLEERDDIIENAVQLAITQSAEVIPVRYHEDLDGNGSIAALLRF